MYNLHRHTACALLLLVCAAGSATAQFVTPLPRPHDDQLAATGSLRRHLASMVKEIAAACDESIKASADAAVTSARACRSQKAHIDRLAETALTYCENVFQGKYLAAKYVQDCTPTREFLGRVLGEGTAIPRARYSPIAEGRLGVVQLYGEAGDLRLLSKFAANLRDDQIFVLTDVISGVVGVLPFAISTASIVTKDDSASVPGLTSDLTRLINNGGSISARIGAPLFASNGTNVRTALSVYTQGGLLGDLAQTDSLAASGSFVLEGIGGFAIRKPDGRAGYLGDIVVGARLAHAWKEADFGPAPIDTKSFSFAQFAIGLTQGEGKLGVSVLITRAFSNEIDGQIRRMVVNLSAVR